jgi:hypothetical protein
VTRYERSREGTWQLSPKFCSSSTGTGKEQKMRKSEREEDKEKKKKIEQK